MAASASLPATPAPALQHPLRNSNFRRLWMGSAISFLGDQFYLVALPWVVLQRNWLCRCDGNNPDGGSHSARCVDASWWRADR